MLSFLCTLDMSLKSAKLFGPERLHLVKPCLERQEGFRAEPVDTQASILLDPLFFNFDKPAGPQHSQVSTHRGPAHRAISSEFPSPARTLPEKFYHAAPGRVGQRGKRYVKIKITRHVLPIKLLKNSLPVGARVVSSGRVGLYGRPPPLTDEVLTTFTAG
jgi:hypothetical protein